MSVIPDAAVTGADVKHAVVAGLADLAAHLETHPGITWPVPVVNIPVPGRTQEEKLAGLDRIAREWGSEVTGGPLGMRIMVRRFGGLAVEAHVSASRIPVTVATEAEEVAA
jgi:hypothetical protein